MSEQATPPQPPDQRKPQNWLGLGCYGAVIIIVLLGLILLIGMCSMQGIHERAG